MKVQGLEDLWSFHHGPQNIGDEFYFKVPSEWFDVVNVNYREIPGSSHLSYLGHSNPITSIYSAGIFQWTKALIQADINSEDPIIDFYRKKYEAQSNS